MNQFGRLVVVTAPKKSDKEEKSVFNAKDKKSKGVHIGLNTDTKKPKKDSKHTDVAKYFMVRSPPVF